VRSTFGFGEALIAVPLLSFILPLDIAVPMSVMLSVAIALLVVIQDHKKIDLQSAKDLVLAALIGLPIGLCVLLYGNDILIKISLGLLLIGYAIYALTAKDTALKNTGNNTLWLWICGIASGVLGGAFGINGPPLVIYGKMKGWNPSEFRATLQGYFLPVSFISVIGYFFKDLITEEVLLYFLKSIPVMIPAIYIGRWLNQRIKHKEFFIYVYIGLIIIGITSILNTWL
jgi:uncharacterized membrane protein YfcA